MIRSIIVGVLLLYSSVSYSLDPKTYIPKNAYSLLPVIKEEQNKYWKDIPLPNYFGGLIEHESCLSLTHSRCFSSKSRLKTSREEGAGLGQITRAYNSNGTIRFDALTELKDKHPDSLKEMSWDSIYQRPDIQIRGMIIKTQDNYKSLYYIKDPVIRLHFADASYNQGLGKTNKDRLTCSLKAKCDQQKWFDNVEKSCSGSNKIIYGDRGPCDISRHHVDDVFNTRMNKYIPYLSKEK